MNKYGQKMEVPHPSPNCVCRVWFEDVVTIVWEITDLESGIQTRERFRLLDEHGIPVTAEELV